MLSSGLSLRALFEKNGLRKNAESASGQTIFSALGLNAVNLETQAKSLIPYNAPFYNSTPRVTSDVGGLTVQWKAVLAASAGFITLPESERNQAASLLERDYSAPFKSSGVDVDVSMFAQETGREFQDNLGFAQFSALQMFLRAQDQQLLCDGNSGTSGNGYELGTTPTPTVALVLNSTVQGSIPASTHVSVRIVALTPFGLRAQKDPFVNPLNGTGLTPQLSAVSMTGDTITASGGTAAVSASSNVVETDSTHQTIQVSYDAPFGAVAFAVYVDSDDTSSPPAADAFFAGIFNGESCYITALPSDSNQPASATGLNVDYSYDVNAVDSYFAWAVNWSSQGESATGDYAAFQSYVADQGGSTLTAVGDGSIQEFTDAADYLYNNYKSAPDRILIASQTVSGTSLKAEIQKAMLSGSEGFGNSSASRIIFESKDGEIKGGTKQLAYEWPYSYDGISKVITIEVMPWLQPGMIVFQTTQNPYPQAAGRIPAAWEVHALLDTFSIVWPIRKLQRELGVYNFTATKSYLPHVAAALQNVG
jgi:hypothetical protein